MGRGHEGGSQAVANVLVLSTLGVEVFGGRTGGRVGVGCFISWGEHSRYVLP